MNQIVAFYKKNKLLIWGALIILVLLKWCQYQADTKYRQTPPSERIVNNPNPQPMPELPASEPQPQSNPWLPYFILVGMTLIVYIAQKRGWIEKIAPSIFLLRVKLFKQNNRQMMRISFLNYSKHTNDVESPVVEFIKPGQIKAFRIKVADNEMSFPISLTRQTSHVMLIDLDRFYERVPELKKFHWVRVTTTLNANKVKRTFPRLVWSSFFNK
jgi:hypothetical protein